MLRIGVTGGIGSGKSTVCTIFSKFDVPVYEADARAKDLMNEDEELRRQITDLFGDEAYTEHGRLNRPFIAEVIFNSSLKATELEEIVHPRVAEDFESWASAKEEQGFPYVLKEAALLYEAGSHKLLDAVIVVSAPTEIKIQRVLDRDPHRSRDQVVKIMQKQRPDHQKEQLADFVITNNRRLMLIPQIKDIHTELLRRVGRDIENE